MEKGRIQEIAAQIYENKILSLSLAIMAEKSQKGIGIETDIKEFAEKISATEEEIKEFLKKCFSEFKNLT